MFGAHRKVRWSWRASALLLGLVLLGGSVALADIPDGNTINTCRNTTTGALRVIDKSAGAQCAAGEAALSWSNWKWAGIWRSSTTYRVADVVTHYGSSYIAQVAPPVGTVPTNTTYWRMVASKGAVGARGLTGLIGPQGVQGLVGAIGPQGVQGLVGAIGPQGVQGLVGAIGPQGVQGAVGAVGAVGPQGAVGAVGPQGAVGAVGPQGAVGAVGPQGAVGAVGPQGAVGAVGPQGAVGAVGPQGAVGAVGPQGAVGAVGPQGAVGAVGPQGAVGAVGPQGAVGAVGPQGPVGAVGPQGVQGPVGGIGPQGPVGAVGPQGIQGVQGVTGATGAGADPIFAKINSNGTIVYANHVTTAGVLANVYTINFDQNVSQCAVNAVSEQAVAIPVITVHGATAISLTFTLLGAVPALTQTPFDVTVTC